MAIEETIVAIKPDSFWRGLNGKVEERIKALGLEVVAECTLRKNDKLPPQDQNLSADGWQEFYRLAFSDDAGKFRENLRPCWVGTALYMENGPIKVMHLKGENAIKMVRDALGKTRPWQADKGTIRGDHWEGAEEANAEYRKKFQQPGDENFIFNMVHASDSPASFKREHAFFKDKLKAPEKALPNRPM